MAITIYAITTYLLSMKPRRAGSFGHNYIRHNHIPVVYEAAQDPVVSAITIHAINAYLLYMKPYRVRKFWSDVRVVNVPRTRSW